MSQRFIQIPIWALSLLMLCVSTVSASWAYSFVVNDGRLFIISDEKVSEDLIGDVVGEVTYHSTQEGSYNGNFSNHYEAGTQYYAIQGPEVVKPEVSWQKLLSAHF